MMACYCVTYDEHLECCLGFVPEYDESRGDCPECGPVCFDE